MIPPPGCLSLIHGLPHLTQARLLLKGLHRMSTSWVIVLGWVPVDMGGGVVGQAFQRLRADLWFMYVPSGTMSHVND